MEIAATYNHDLPNLDAYENGQITIDQQLYTTPIVLHQSVEILPENWQPEDLTLTDFQAALNAGADIVVVGTGATQRFLSPQLTAQLAQHGVGLACMSTAAACRTVMLLQSENRHVWAWLLP